MTDPSMRVALDKMLVDYFRKTYTANYGTPPSVDPAPPVEPITVRKIAGYFKVPVELLEQRVTRPDVPYAPWHRRARWRWQYWRLRGGVRIGTWIAGTRLIDEIDE